jgi:hypothetical protein
VLERYFSLNLTEFGHLNKLVVVGKKDEDMRNKDEENEIKKTP